MERFGWRFSYFIWGLPVLLSTLLLLSLPAVKYVAHKERESEEDEAVIEDVEDSRFKIISRYFLLLLLAMGVNGIGRQALSAYMTTYLISVRSLSESAASMLYGLSPFFGILGSLIGGYLGDRLGSKRWISTAYAGRILVYTEI